MKKFLPLAVTCVLALHSWILLCGFNVDEAADFANLHCGAWSDASCPDQNAQSPFYNRFYACFENTIGHCGESMEYWRTFYNDQDYTFCYDVGSDCANFLSQILQSGCGGLCEHYFNFVRGDYVCNANELIRVDDNYFDPSFPPGHDQQCVCEAGWCNNVRRERFNRALCWYHTSPAFGGLLTDDHWNGVDTRHAFGYEAISRGDFGCSVNNGLTTHVIFAVNNWRADDSLLSGNWRHGKPNMDCLLMDQYAIKFVFKKEFELLFTSWDMLVM